METQVAATAPVQASEPTANVSSEPDLQNMTGEEAVKYVEAQKAKENQKTVTPKQTKDVVSKDTVKEALQEAKRKLKVDNEEIDEDEVVRIYRERKGHQREANKILQEGKTARKQAEEFITLMRDPEKFYDVAKRLGHDPRLLAEKYLVAQLEDEMLDPRERELRQTKSKLQSFEQLEAEREKQRVEAENRAKAEVEEKRIAVLKEKFAVDYTKQFTEALNQVEIPAAKDTVAAMAKYIARAAEMDFKMTALEAAQLVKEDLITTHRRLIGESDGEILIKLLGEDVANKVRKWDTSRLKNPEPQRSTPLEQGQPRERRVSGGKRMTPKQWREFNRR